EPNATPFGQSWRLWNLRYFKQTRVKMPGGVLLPGGHGELNVFYCFDLHSSYSRNSAPVEYPDIVLISTATANLFSGAEATATVLQFVTDGNRALAGTTLTACGEYQRVHIQAQTGDRLAALLCIGHFASVCWTIIRCLERLAVDDQRQANAKVCLMPIDK